MFLRVWPHESRIFLSRTYSPALARNTYDAIIIGSGIGGLTTAAFLARFGRKVLILERHDVPGGFTHTFKRKGYEWDVGVHYVGQVNDPGNLMRQVLDYVSDGNLEWSPRGEVYDRVVIEGRSYDLLAGYEAQPKQMIGYFPQEAAAIRRYFGLIRDFPLSSGLFFGERSMPKWPSLIFGFFMRRNFLKRARRTTYEVLRELTDNETLIAVLCFRKTI
jgi:all-trans-retinol 13,14-reductase